MLVHSRFFVLTGMFFLLFLLCLGMVWPEGQAAIRGILFSGDGDAAMQAMKTLVMQLREDVPVMDAVDTFCATILEGSGYGAY